MSPRSSLPIAITMGDPAGIGPDVIAKTIAQLGAENLPKIAIIGRSEVLRARAKLISAEVDIASSGFREKIEFIETKNTMTGTSGEPDVRNAAAIIEAIEIAVKGCAEGRFSAIVTAPINKKILYNAGFQFPGHTEFLAHLAALESAYALDAAPTPVMMIAGPELRTIPVTIHIALNQVSANLTSDLIIETCQIAHRDLRDRFSIEKPALAVSGLNPHAGEEASMGTEDRDIIAPAIAELKKQSINAFGPLPADTMFHARARASYDAAICMYHDQALIPAKTLAFDDGVNVTLGLPFIRTSPDHGTAYEIAGTGKARADSFIAALEMAREMVNRSADNSLVEKMVQA